MTKKKTAAQARKEVDQFIQLLRFKTACGEARIELEDTEKYPNLEAVYDNWTDPGQATWFIAMFWGKEKVVELLRVALNGFLLTNFPTVGTYRKLPLQVLYKRFNEFDVRHSQMPAELLVIRGNLLWDVETFLGEETSDYWIAGSSNNIVTRCTTEGGGNPRARMPIVMRLIKKAVSRPAFLRMVRKHLKKGLHW